MLRAFLRLSGFLAGVAFLALVSASLLSQLPVEQVPQALHPVHAIGKSVNQQSLTFALILAGMVMAIAAFTRTALFGRLMEGLANDAVSNWRLLLLGLTGILLSVASGYTTWDGMTNFTCPDRAAGNPCFGPMLLSLLITFGIQGVMLIAAWLIGESFAQGLHQGRHGRPASKRVGVFYWLFWTLATLAIVAAAAVVLALATVNVFGVETVAKAVGQPAEEIRKLTTQPIALYEQYKRETYWGAIGFLALLALLYALSEREIVGPYVRGARIILKNLPIWIMFLICMGTSVFFSFDSLFSTIFPADERARAAELRTTNQVAGMVSDLGAVTQTRRTEAIEKLFVSSEWAAYETELDKVVALANEAPELITAEITKKLQDRQGREAQLQQEKASAESQRVRRATDKTSLLEKVNRLKSETPPLAAEAERLKSEIFAKDTEIRAKDAEMKAEAGGVGGTLKEGRGPEFAKRQKEKGDLEKLRFILVDQQKQVDKQLTGKLDEIKAAESEIAQIDAELGTLQGRIEVADQQITLGATKKDDGSAAVAASATFDPQALEKLRADFRQSPTAEAFAAIQQTCVGYVQAFDTVASLKTKAGEQGMRCDPTPVAELTSRTFALGAGLAAYKELCGKENSLPQTGTEALLEFGEKCVQTTGLAGEDTAVFRNRLNGIALNRDDKAHRFVVTMNAFLDGNRLAHLALAIAVAIDGLVFMSGLFGANAVRSPLTEVPHGKSRSASQLEAVLLSALGGDRFVGARTVLAAMKPITPIDGFSSSVDLVEVETRDREVVVNLLNAAAVIGGARHDGGEVDRYLVRAEVYEFLSDVYAKELRTNKAAQETVRKEQEAAEAMREEERKAEEHYRRESYRETAQTDFIQQRAERLVPHLSSTLLPDIKRNVEILETALKPVTNDEMRKKEFSSEYFPVDPVTDEFIDEEASRRIIERALNAGANLKAVERHVFPRFDRDNQMRNIVAYYVKPEFGVALTIVKLTAHGVIGSLRGRRLGDAFESIEPAALSRPALSASRPTALLTSERAPVPDAELPVSRSEARPGPATRDATDEMAHADPSAETMGEPANDQFDDDETTEWQFLRRYAKTLGIKVEMLNEIEEESDEWLSQIEVWRGLNAEAAKHVENLKYYFDQQIAAVYDSLADRATDRRTRTRLDKVTERIRQIVPAMVCHHMLKDFGTDAEASLTQ